MGEKTLFFVQPFVMRHHKLAAAGALTFLEPEDALETGADLARRRAGIVVLAQSYDPSQKMLAKPKVLKIHGKVPAEWTASRMAA